MYPDNALSKYQVKEAIYTYLYTPVQRQCQRRLDQLIQQNNRLCHSSLSAFMYKGELYQGSNTSLYQPNQRPPRLHRSLVPVMEQYLAELKTLNEHELPFVLGFITHALNSVKTLPDCLRIFPESVHPPIKHLIASCSCRTMELSQETVEEIQARNQAAIDLMKQRQVLNLLL